MNTNDQTYSPLDYEEISSLACQIWQELGCPFGQYLQCLAQSKVQLHLAERPVCSARPGLPGAERPCRRKRADRINRTKRHHRL